MKPPSARGAATSGAPRGHLAARAKVMALAIVAVSLVALSFVVRPPRAKAESAAVAAADSRPPPVRIEAPPFEASRPPVRIEAPPLVSGPLAKHREEEIAVVVDLNDATFDDLRKLSGVGPKRATAILELRARLGRFRRVEELLRVRGFGRKTLARLRPHLRIGAPPPAPP